MLENLVMLALQKGWDSLEKGSEAKKLRLAIRSRLARETRFNLEVFKGLDDPDKLSLVAAACSIEAIDEICSLNIPISLFFDGEELPEGVIEYLRGESVSNGNFKKWTADIHNEVELVERVWHRLRILKVRYTQQVALGDLDYGRHLLQALLQSLTENKASKPKG